MILTTQKYSMGTTYLRIFKICLHFMPVLYILKKSIKNVQNQQPPLYVQTPFIMFAKGGV